MQLGLEAVGILVFFVLPGFVITVASGAIRHIRQGAERGVEQSAAAIIAHGTVLSILTNIIAILLFGVLSYNRSAENILSLNFGQIVARFNNAPILDVITYTIVLYIIAIVAGIILGFKNIDTLHAFLKSIDATAVSPEEAVWLSTLKSIQEDDGIRRDLGISQPPIRWLHVIPGEGPAYFGPIGKGSVRVARDKPIEVYLKPAYRVEAGVVRTLGISGKAASAGVYLRIEPSTRVEFYAAPSKSWRPMPDSIVGAQGVGEHDGVTVLPGTIFCTGEEENHAHPGVYLVPGQDGFVNCPYCSRQFFRA